MNPLSKEQLQKCTAEQIAGITLMILREIDSGAMRVPYYSGSIKGILAYELAPRWLGREVRNGCLILPGGGVTMYGGDEAPIELANLYNEGIDILRREQLIKQDPTQNSPEFISITDKGRKSKINDRYELSLNRKPEVIINKYKSAVLLIETFKSGEVSCGTCFVWSDGLLVTCKHNIENRGFKVHFDKETCLEDVHFNVRFHKTRDLAIIAFKSAKMSSILRGIVPLEVEEYELNSGEQLVTMGYPLVPQRNSQLLSDVGTFQNYTESYLDSAKYLTFSNKIDGGCSGGPVISLRGKVAGVITESTENNVSSVGERLADRNIYGHATPAIHIYDMRLS